MKYSVPSAKRHPLAVCELSRSKTYGDSPALPGWNDAIALPSAVTVT
jgi:hypothetical protein